MHDSPLAALRGPARKAHGRAGVSRFGLVSRLCGQARQAVKARQVGGVPPLSGRASFLQYLEPCRSYLPSEEPLEACLSQAMPYLCSYSRWNS